MRLPTQNIQRGLQFNITPLIDVVFLLIIFFLVASHFIRNEQVEQVELPTATQGKDEDEAASRIVITVATDQRLMLGPNAATLDEIERRVRELDHRPSQFVVDLELFEHPQAGGPSRPQPGHLRSDVQDPLWMPDAAWKRVHVVRGTTVDGAAGAATAKRIAEKAAAAAARPVNAYLTDSTLRRGDVVATTKGLRVFVGARHFPYREHDFVALSHAQTFGNKGVLAALDRTLRRAPDSGARSAARTASRRAAPAAYIRVADATTRPDARPGAGAPSPSRILAFAPQQSDTAPAVQALDRIIRKIDLTRPPVAATRRSDGRAGEQLSDIRRRDAR